MDVGMYISCVCLTLMFGICCRNSSNDYSRLSVDEVDVPDKDFVNTPMTWKAAPFRDIDRSDGKTKVMSGEHRDIRPSQDL